MTFRRELSRLSLLLAALTATGCARNATQGLPPAEQSAIAGAAAGTRGVTEEPFGTVAGKPVSLFTFQNAHGMRVRAMSYGGIILSLDVPDRNGTLGDVVLGFDSLSQYVASSPYFGAIIGRYGNRIGGARFTLDGQIYRLTPNDHGNTLHGGRRGFDKVVWQAEPFQDATGRGVVFHYTSPAGDQGFPGTLTVQVRYTLTDRNELIFDYQATTDQATPVNLTQHSYFNLRGAGNGDILGHVVTINADSITPVDSLLIPTGEIRPVAGTPFDFRTPTPIGARIGENDTQLRYGPGYDHNWVLNRHGPGLVLAARVVEPTTGRVMEIQTTEPGLQFYSGNFLNGLRGKGGAVYRVHDGFAMETQHYPDSPNRPSFPSTILRPGQEYRSRSIYRFSVLP